MAVELLEAQLPEGTRLPPEEELCGTMACSRASLRSALRLLESWGLVTIQTGREGGPVVRSPRVSDLGDALSVLIHCEHATLMDVLIARRTIDPVIAAAAAARATPEHIEQLGACLKRIRNSMSQREYLFATSEFPRILADASGLVLLGLFLRILTSFGEESHLQRLQFDSEWKDHNAASFERIRDAVAAHDSDLASTTMADQRRESERHWHVKGQAILDLPFGPFEFSS
jgi:DNA-binding FadR family transcriptional regulator